MNANVSSPAPAPAVPLERWAVPAADFAALKRGPVLCPLDDQAVLEFQGPEAAQFLQGQTTSDLLAADAATWRLGGYCTPKGRLLAIFQAWRDEQAVRLLLPRSIAGPILRRLSMYILRAKVKASDGSAAWAIFGLCGPGSSAALRAAGYAAPADAWQAARDAHGSQVVAQPHGAGCAERFLCAVKAEQAADFAARLAGVARGSAALWNWTQIDAALPLIQPATSERFVPQALQLEVLGGVDFRKGCYPGQEVVARSQYLGKLRRRMYLGHSAQLGAQDDIYADGVVEPVGRLVAVADAPQGGWDLLFECLQERVPADAHAGSGLRAGAPEAAMLALRPLPYTLFDPTA